MVTVAISTKVCIQNVGAKAKCLWCSEFLVSHSHLNSILDIPEVWMQLPECRVTLRLYAWQVVQVYGNGCTRYLLTQHWVNFFLFFFPSFCLFVSGGLTNKHTQNPGSAGHFQIYQTSIRVRGKGGGWGGREKISPRIGIWTRQHFGPMPYPVDQAGCLHKLWC